MTRKNKSLESTINSTQNNSNSHNEYSTYLSSACESSAAGTSSDGAENLIALATKIEKSKKRKSILSTPSESFTAMSAGDDDNSFEGADEEDDDELNEFRKWNLNEKISDMNTYNADFVRFFDAKVFNYTYIQKNGFSWPIVFLDKSGLDMRTPSKIFTVHDIKTCVGSKRVIDVMDCSTQKGFTMTMKEWCEYYENIDRDRILNVISLEFSHTKLEDYVEAPLLVRQMDWIETAWPHNLRMSQTDPTNSIEQMKYPKVQKYVLMSVAECYTDFHIDMGGTSVWYHVLKGEKIFFLIPPTDTNLEIYQKWVMSGKQSDQFLPDLVETCQRIVLQQGSTFLLPSGWIHAVYTSKDSIVFGGNFLHSFNIEMQLKIYKLESKTRVPDKYRYPFFVKMLWFLIERYVHCFTGVTHLNSSCYIETSGIHSLIGQLSGYKTFEPDPRNAKTLSRHEINGLKAVYNFMLKLNENKRIAPGEIIDSNSLLEKFKDMIDKKTNDLTAPDFDGSPFIYWPKLEKKFLKKISTSKPKSEHNEPNSDEEFNQLETSSLASSNLLCETESINSSSVYTKTSETRKHTMRNIPRTKGSIKKRLRPHNLPRSNVERRRRVRCHRCEPCTRDDCGECKYCKDMKKFGGTGISKQCCLSKQCLQPLLPTTTTCMLCDVIIDRKHENETNIMYECEICFEIYHAKCFKLKYSELTQTESIVNEDLNNCWQCASCLNKGYIKQSELLDACSGSNGNVLKFSENSSLHQQLSLNTSSNFSDSLNNSFNSSRTNDMFVSPLSINGAETDPPLKKKRHRRTKLEILNAKKELPSTDQTPPIREQNSKPQKLKLKKNKKFADRSVIISIDSLSSYEKQIILNEFCEVYDPNSNQDQCDDEAKRQQQQPTANTIQEDDEDSAASIDNNYSMSTQNSFSNFMYSENEDEDNVSMKYFDENEFDLLGEQKPDRQPHKENGTNGGKKNSSESLLKMIQTN